MRHRMTKEEAIAAFGSVRKLSDALGITEQAVHQWGSEVPALRVYQIKELIRMRKTKKNGASA